MVTAAPYATGTQPKTGVSQRRETQTTHENARVAAGVLVLAKSVGQFSRSRPPGRRRRANQRPARPRPKRERLAGSGTDRLVWVKVLLIEVKTSPLPTRLLFTTPTLETPGLKVTDAVPLFDRGDGSSVMPFIELEVTIGGDTVGTSTPTVPITIVAGAAAVTV
jgi:hypothetical protein